MEATTERLTYINGTWVPESKAGIHIYDSQFMFGDGVFEMYRTFNHKAFLFDEHIDRLFMSMRSYSIPIDKTRAEIRDICEETCDINGAHFENDEFRVMINVSRGPLPIYRDVFKLAEGEAWGRPTWIVNVWPLSKTARTLAHFYETGANAVIVSQRQIPAQYLDPKVKSRSRAHLQLANIQASAYGRDAQALLLDDDGFVTEGTGSNFIMVRNNALIVPELRNLLRGCSMSYVLDVLAPKLDLDVFERNIEPYDVLDADEAMFTGTFTNLIPCNRLNGQFIRGCIDQEPMGPITKKICNAWAEEVGMNFIDQVKMWDSR